jgi:hypothetical protein
VDFQFLDVNIALRPLGSILFQISIIYPKLNSALEPHESRKSTAKDTCNIPLASGWRLKREKDEDRLFSITSSIRI